MWLASTDDLPALKSFYERALHLKQRGMETGNQFVIEQQERIIATLAVRINMESRWLSPINKQQLAISLRTTVNTKTSRGNPKAAWLWELVGEEPFSCYQQTGGLPQCWVDLVIRHPEPTYRNGRPAWLRTPDRCVVQGRIVPPASTLVQLHLTQEGSAGTPIDQYLTEEDGAFELLAPKGTYLLRWWSPDERVIGERPVTLHTGRCEIDLPLA